MYPYQESKERETILIKWLNEIQENTEALYLMGDIFDFWYEYKKVVPRGFVRFLGKLAEFSDRGIPVYFFTGNHDVWAFDYLHEEIGITVYNHHVEHMIRGKKFYLAHGDGLGPGDKAYLILKWAFHNRLLQWLFSRLHPNFALSLGHLWSKRSRISKGIYVDYKGTDKEWLILHAKEVLEMEHFDYFVFGHRHLPMEIALTPNSSFYCLGDWITHFTYAVFDGDRMQLKSFRGKENNFISKQLW